jgi:curved DNA-binding protein CbpA
MKLPSMELLPAKSYFSLFKLRPEFSINQDELKKSYFSLSRESHPDLTREKGAASIQELNRAYRTLSNDYLRAKYLTDFKEIEVDHPFLVNVLEVEESIAEAEDSQRLQAIRRTIDSRIAECKLNYNKKEYMGRWPYYERLKEKLDRKMNGAG